MRVYSKHVDMRSREQMERYLADHFRYPTMNSWNNSTSYANNVKIHRLGLTAEQVRTIRKVLEHARKHAADPDDMTFENYKDEASSILEMCNEFENMYIHPLHL